MATTTPSSCKPVVTVRGRQIYDKCLPYLRFALTTDKPLLPSTSTAPKIVMEATGLTTRNLTLNIGTSYPLLKNATTQVAIMMFTEKSASGEKESLSSAMAMAMLQIINIGKGSCLCMFKPASKAEIKERETKANESADNGEGSKEVAEEDHPSLEVAGAVTLDLKGREFLYEPVEEGEGKGQTTLSVALDEKGQLVLLINGENAEKFERFTHGVHYKKHIA
ncbi:MAG: hypothetical protein MMC23_002921 [Stictis urceolatum]|nr:hypothetical protein [Stictis urceolata]